jgi:hypothetical protein
MSQDDYQTDERHVRAEVRRFKQHLLTYCVVVGVLFVINVLSGGFWHGDFWFLWVAFFWGIAVVFQAARLFSDDVGRDWEDRTVSRIMERRYGRPYTPPAAPDAPPKPAGDAPAKPRGGLKPEPVSDYAPPAARDKAKNKPRPSGSAAAPKTPPAEPGN